MSYLTLLLILVSVSLSVFAQLLLKVGMSNSTVQASLSSNITVTIMTIFTNMSVLLGWLLVLSRTDVSKAYPFVGLGFIGTMMFACWFLNEPLTPSKVIGTFVICVGVLLISR
jgi:multidrug transporter EmrE-like cation transporter